MEFSLENFISRIPNFRDLVSKRFFSIYDPFTKTTLAELLEKQKGNSKFSNESQCLPDIFDELRDEDDKKRCEEANEDDNDVELIRIFENQDRGMDIETNMRQKIFRNLKLNRLKFKFIMD